AADVGPDRHAGARVRGRSKRHRQGEAGTDDPAAGGCAAAAHIRRTGDLRRPGSARHRFHGALSGPGGGSQSSGSLEAADGGIRPSAHLTPERPRSSAPRTGPVAQGNVVEGASVRYLPLLAGLLACGQQPASRLPPRGTETASLAAQPPIVVSVETVTVQVPLRLQSQLYVEHDAAVFARSSGIVQSILADLGSRVRAGQLLAQPETTDQEIALP